MFELLISAASILGEEHPAEATPLYERGLQLARDLHPDSLELAEVLAAFGWHERRASRFERAIPMLRESLELRRRLQGEDHDEYIGLLEVLANTLGLDRRFDQAEPLFEQALELRRRNGSRDSIHGAWSLAQYASMLSNAGRPLQSLGLYTEIFAIADRKMSADDGARVIWAHNMAMSALNAGDRARAAELMTSVLATMRQRGDTASRSAARMLLSQGRVRGQDDCDSEAGADIAQAVSIYQAVLEPDDPDLDEARIDRTRWLVGCGEFAEAAGLLSLRRDNQDAPLREAEARAILTYTADDPRGVMVRLPRLRWLSQHGRQAEAAALAREILGGLEGKLVAHAPVLAELRALSKAPIAQ